LSGDCGPRIRESHGDGVYICRPPLKKKTTIHTGDRTHVAYCLFFKILGIPYAFAL